MIHGQYVCQCGRKLAGCNCPEHQGKIVKTYNACNACRPETAEEYARSHRKPDTRPLKEKLGVEEKPKKGQTK